ncbi:MAG: hypothetical protein L0H63_12215 [Nitrococcus sp.]|nr:hypothetical protein [Nitrococcus sp.]
MAAYCSAGRAHRERFLPAVTAALEAFEGRLLAEQQEAEAIAELLYGAGRTELARR